MVETAMPLSFGVTFDYRCPFARNGHEHLVEGLKAGADWDVPFLPFSLTQNKVQEGEASVWEEPEKDSGLLALQLGIAIRDTQPERFLDAHLALFGIRHAQGKSQRDAAILRETLAAAVVGVMDRPRDGLDGPNKVIERVVSLLTGWPELNEFKHTALSKEEGRHA